MIPIESAYSYNEYIAEVLKEKDTNFINQQIVDNKNLKINL